MKRLLAGAFLAFLVAGSIPAMELSIAVAAGPHFPVQEAFRNVYGTAAAFGLDVRWLATRNIGFSAGVMTLGKRGKAVSLDGGTEDMDVDLKIMSVPLTAYVHLRRGRFGFDLGAGLAYHDFEETWVDEVGPAVSGRKWGLLACASAGYDITPRLSIVGRLRYLDVPTGLASRLTDKVNLGGFQALVGVSWRVVR